MSKKKKVDVADVLGVIGGAATGAAGALDGGGSVTSGIGAALMPTFDIGTIVIGAALGGALAYGMKVNPAVGAVAGAGAGVLIGAVG